ncbi:aminoglycoside phosphotransferase family protein [Nocardia sp. NPDC059239]|uniref:aminoglycoside phosphotransferase family protein n=1 Tax=Nocardia sp. NPDC059239 TaxID=3346785 RepID=UPI003698CF49
MTTSDPLTLCRQHIDPQAQPVAADRGNDRTLRCMTPTVGGVFVKVHRHRSRYDRERRAYRRWVPTLAPHAPRLLGAIDNPPALFLTTVAGVAVASAELGLADELTALAQAGALLNAFHAAESVRETTDVAAWLAERGRAWLRLAEGVMSRRERDDIRAHLALLEALDVGAAVPCHLDFTPQNMIFDRDRQMLHIIDFEHARFDLAARDLVRLTDRYFRDRPELAEAFFSTYPPVSDLDRQVIEHCTALDHLTASVRAAGLGLPDAEPIDSRW